LWLGQVCLIALALATAIIVQAAGNPLAKLGWLMLLMAVYFSLTYVSFRGGAVWPVAGPLWVVAGGGVLGLATQVVAEQLEKRRLRLTLERYVSKPVADEILQRSEQYEASLSGQRKPVTILFSDIRGFTSSSEQADAAQLVAQLNEYLTAMVAVVMKNEGTLDKFIGDAIMAVYGAPIGRSPADDAWRAVQTAFEMRLRLAELQRRWEAAGKPVWRIGIGLNHGDVIVGDIGSPQRTEYTVIGDPVNVASRVEGLNKDFGTDILLTESVVDLVRDRVEVKQLGSLPVKGRTQQVAVYALVALRN
jgi:adenylate cyclase